MEVQPLNVVVDMDLINEIGDAFEKQMKGFSKELKVKVPKEPENALAMEERGERQMGRKLTTKLIGEQPKDYKIGKLNRRYRRMEPGMIFGGKIGCISDSRRSFAFGKQRLEAKLAKTNEEIQVIQEQMKKAHASEIDSVRLITLEIKEATKALQEASEEESSLRNLVSSLRTKLEQVKKEKE
ncbi:WEB family protein [Sesbania bispinosa]|nr:WEB family protein [Sesbania bispinosa]